MPCRRPRLRETALALAAALLAGCAAGPDFVAPPPPRASGYAPDGLPLQTHAAPAADAPAQRLLPGAAAQPRWWTTLGSARLDAFIDDALRASPTVEAAHAALRAAQEATQAQRGAALPTLQAGYTALRQRPADGSAGTSTLHTAQLSAVYTPDVFGANSRLVEALQAQAGVQRFQLEAARALLAASIAAAAIQDGLLREQIRIVEQMIEAGSGSVEIARRQWKAGALSRLDVALQESALAQNRQLLPPLRKQFEQNRDQLRALAGALPDTQVPAFALADLQLPEQLPLSLPSQVVAQRPDVRAAQEQLHAASAQVGVARAARLPQFTLDGSVGKAAMQLGQLMAGQGFFSLAAAVTQPLLDGGTLQHREAAARETLRQADAQYRATVVGALQNVADTLQAIHADADALQAAAEQAASAGTALALTRRQYGHGYLDRVALINAEQTDRQARLALAQASAARLADAVALHHAIGGGWSGDAVAAQDTAR